MFYVDVDPLSHTAKTLPAPHTCHVYRRLVLCAIPRDDVFLLTNPGQVHTQRAFCARHQLRHIRCGVKPHRHVTRGGWSRISCSGERNVDTAYWIRPAGDACMRNPLHSHMHFMTPSFCDSPGPLSFFCPPPMTRFPLNPFNAGAREGIMHATKAVGSAAAAANYALQGRITKGRVLFKNGG